MTKAFVFIVIISFLSVVINSLIVPQLETWEIIADVATVIALVFLILQIHESTKARHLEGLILLFSILNTKDARAERRAIYAAHVEGRKLGGKEIEFAEKIRADFNAIGIMVKEGLLPKRIALRQYSDTAIRRWESLKEYIEKEREKRGPSFLEDFEWFYEESKRYRSKKYPREEIKIFKQT